MSIKKFQLKLSTLAVFLTFIIVGFGWALHCQTLERKFEIRLDNEVLFAENQQTMRLAYVYEGNPDVFPLFIRCKTYSAIHEAWENAPSLESSEQLKHMQLVHELLELLDCESAKKFFAIHRDLPPELVPILPDSGSAKSKELERFILDALKEEYSGKWDY